MEKINTTEKYIEAYNENIEKNFKEIMTGINKFSSSYYGRPLSRYFKLTDLESIMSSVEEFNNNNKQNYISLTELNIDITKILNHLLNDLINRVLKIIDNNDVFDTCYLRFLIALNSEYSFIIGKPSSGNNPVNFHLDDRCFNVLKIVDSIYRNTFCYQNSYTIMNDNIIDLYNDIKNIIDNDSTIKKIFKTTSQLYSPKAQELTVDLILNSENCLENFKNNKKTYFRDGHKQDFNSINSVILFYNGDRESKIYKDTVNELLEDKLRNTPKIHWEHYYGRNNFKILTKICEFVDENKNIYKYNTKNIKKINSIRLNSIV